jgi:nicotinate-nucleotide pyrophosphorylase (carboxylating)
MSCPEYLSKEFIKYVLDEDIGRGDVTTSLIENNDKPGVAVIKAKEELVLCGVDVAAYVFEFIDENLKIEKYAADGERLEAGTRIMTVTGSSGSILKAERTALNFLQRLSGISTTTAQYVEKIDKNSKTAIVDTRKTIPGLRTLEKYAVRTGGAKNHRFGLDDGIMIKDNHIALAGSIEKAVNSIRSKAHHLLKIEVETTCLEEVKEALAAGADVIMLDNMSPDLMRQSIEIIGKNALVEISGGVTLEKIEILSGLGADFISVGAITHSAVAKDINLTLKI